MTSTAACPGVDDRSRVLHLRAIQDATCCAEWDAGLAPTPARAEGLRRAAAQTGMTWPRIKPEADRPEPEAEATL